MNFKKNFQTQTFQRSKKMVKKGHISLRFRSEAAEAIFGVPLELYEKTDRYSSHNVPRV